jgi:transposase-like protein
MKKRRKRKTGVQAPGGPRQLSLHEFVRSSLYDTVLRAGLAHVAQVLEEERAAVCGQRYRHNESRTAYRAGSVPSSLVLGGRKVIVARPRVRTLDDQEVMLPSWAGWTATDPLDMRAVEQMIVGVSTRDYHRSLEPLPEEARSRSTSKSSVSRRFIRGTQQQLEKLMSRSLEEVDVVALYLDGVHVGDHVAITAVGVDATGKKHVLGLWEGATEHSATCTALLEDLVERGLHTNRALLVVIDGSKALRKAVTAVFGKRALIQRCQEHKKRNVLDALPTGKRVSVKRSLNEAFRTRDVKRARRLLDNLIRRLAEDHPGAAESLKEGLDELLTVKGLALDEKLERMLSTTNVIENMIGNVRDVSVRVKRWRSGRMVLRWCAAGMLEAERHFRRIKGHDKLKSLVTALGKHDAQLDGRFPDRAVVAA